MTIYLKDLVALAAGDVDKGVAEELVKRVFSQVLRQVSVGNRVFVSGFGSFEYHIRPARKARNPKTGAAVEVKATRSLKFTPVPAHRKVPHE